MIELLNSENAQKYRTDFFDINSLLNELLNNPFGNVLLYINDNNILGYLYYSDIYERAEINNIEVRQSDRNKKIGTKLLEFLTNSVDKSISLEVRKNNFAAIKLYEKFDFKAKALRKGYYQGIDGILMVREKQKESE